MLGFFVIIDFIDYQFLSIINANRSAGERIQISNICAYYKMSIRTECESVQSKVVSIDKSRFERRQELVQSVSIELVYQICVKIFSLAVDKRTKNNLSSLSFASIELTFGFNRMNS